MSKFTTDTSITFVTKVMQLFLGIGTSVAIARILGPRDKGVYSLAILLSSLIINFGNIGIGKATIYYIGKKKYTPIEILGNNILLSFFLSTVGFIAGSIIIFFFGSSLFPGVGKTYLILALFLVPLQLLFILTNSILLGLQKIKEYNFINIINSFILLFLILIFLLIFKYGLKSAIMANVLSCLLGIIVLFYFIKKIIRVFHLSINRSYVKDSFQYGSKVYFGNIIQFFHYKLDIFLINYLLNPTAVGFYSVSVALAEKIWLASQSASTVLFPRVSSETDKNKLKDFTPIICRNVLLITFIGAVLLFFTGRLLIILLYSETFSSSVVPFQILLIGAVAASGWRILANDLYGRGKPELNIYISLISLILNIILNILWIPKFGINGAALATSISYTFSFITIIIIYSKISENNLFNTIFLQKTDFKLYKRILIEVLKTKT